MKNFRMILAHAAPVVALCATLLHGGDSLAADKSKKPVLVSVTRFETQEKGRDADGSFNPEAYMTNMLLFNKKLSKKNFASVFYSHRICLSDSQTASNDIGITRTTQFNKRTSGNIGYSFSRSNQRGPRTPRNGSDRFNAGVRYIFNRGARKSAETAFSASFTTATDLESGQSFTAGFSTVLHIIPKKYDFSFGSKFSYGLQGFEFSHGETQTLQYDFSLSYMKGKNKYTAGFLFIDNTFTNNVGDNAIYSFTRTRKL